MVLFLSAYIVFKEIKNVDRYAQTIFYAHLVNHILRDYLAELQRGHRPDPKNILVEVLDSIATCFSIVVGKRCRCSVKQLSADFQLSTVCRDTMSRTQHGDSSDIQHSLVENTDFDSIWYAKNGCFRRFQCNDLKKLWRENKYRNSSFKTYGEPESISTLGVTFVRNWNLPYKSTIVWPIRFVPDYKIWPPTSASEGQSARADNAPKVPQELWGFLCVDCNSRGVFDSTYCPELGAAFADALYTLFTQSTYIHYKDQGQGMAHRSQW